jgi:hypothetical protein
MVVFANRYLGPSAELFVSDDVAQAVLRHTANAARPFARARWEIELVLWLDSRADLGPQVLDVSDIAWTREHFDHQRTFLIDAIQGAARLGLHPLVFDRWRRLVELHPRDAVLAGRRWQWPHNPPPGPRSPVPMRDTAADVVDGGERSEAVGYIGTADLSLGR